MNKTSLNQVFKDLQNIKKKIGSRLNDPMIGFYDPKKKNLKMHFMGKKINKSSHDIILKEVKTDDPEKYYEDNNLHGVIIIEDLLE